MNYWKTWNEGVASVHLQGIGDAALCGLDLAGDDLIHDRDPEPLAGKIRITCPHCVDLIEKVNCHLSENPKAETNSLQGKP